MIFLFKIFISQNILLIISYFILTIMCYFKSKMRLNYSFFLKTSYLTLFCSFLLPIVFYLMGTEEIIPRTHQVWGGVGVNQDSFLSLVVNNVEKINDINIENTVSSYNGIVFTTTFICLFIIILSKLVNDILKIKNILKNSFLYKKRGLVEIVFHEKIQIPFSTRIFGKFYVVIPYVLITNHKKLKIIVSHELQHHRQGDTLWIYLTLIFKSLFILNPFFILLERKIYELQEFACDEELVRTKKFSLQDYCECLLWAAQFSLQRQKNLACTASFFKQNATQFLKERIQNIMFFKQKKNSNLSAILLSLCLLGGLSVVAYGASPSAQDIQITMQTAQKMQKNAQASTDFPIVVNEEVLLQLKRFLGNPKGREFIKQSLKNKKKYKEMIEKELKKENLPLELAAIPIVESSYKNTEPDMRPYSAGIWMFIPETAVAMGLSVNAKNDERMNAHLETKAAAKYFHQLYNKYKDWPLAIMSYNYGSEQVDKLIKSTSSHDAWKLIESLPDDSKYSEVRIYLPSVMAAILIEKNPSYLN